VALAALVLSVVQVAVVKLGVTLAVSLVLLVVLALVLVTRLPNTHAANRQSATERFSAQFVFFLIFSLK